MSESQTIKPPSVPQSGASNTSGANDIAQAVPALMDQAKHQANKVVEQTQQKAGEVLEQAKDRTKSWAEDQKSALAQGLSETALAIMQTGETLRRKGPDSYGKYVELTDQAADAVDRASTYLKETSVDQMVGEVENFGKRQPLIFLLGAVTVGVLAARFLRSSGRSAHADSAGYNPDRKLPVPIDEHDRGVTSNYDTTSTIG